MNHLMMQRTLPLALLTLLVGCGSPPTHYHTLAPVPPAAQVAAASGPPLRVADINLPPMLDRRNLMTQTSATEVKIDQQNQWAAPLDRMIQRVLTDDLSARLGSNRVLAPDDPAAPRGTRTVTVSVRQFIADPQGKVILDADWSARGGGADTTPHHVTVSQPAGGTGPNAVVAAMSQTLGQLADRIAAGR